MKARTCPKCNFRLGNFDHYFCTNCGEVLPDDLSNPPILFKSNKYKKVFHELSSASKTFKLYELVLKCKSSKSAKIYVLLALVLIFGLFFTELSKAFFTKIGYSTSSGRLEVDQVSQLKSSGHTISTDLNLS